eukprot:1158269-Pelagomonas_calceolata.AAC.17
MVCPVCIANAVAGMAPAAICAGFGGLACIGGAKAAATSPPVRSSAQAQQQPVPTKGVRAVRVPQPATRIQQQSRRKLLLKPPSRKLLLKTKGYVE